ncbi:FtsX-like permease family protein [Fluoribacter dumoffii]|uniref:Macrolide transporter ATP-binding /permease protein n=1 Tax=Fluoribacter dumoffii TaxID=463 RepID=A0A377G9C0_9GAMM|nr:FtsX-like permease family protein [Fluoribacter dumoffii]KTC90285.1 macrolide transporter ATP-binding /permease protein [Fluoribacter dumoffii NY 23]MCW8385603.1 FtsX-like permease family protein [Fluoribacter dumoffii]MCW8418630.1 FtsX-like permease family protein [Fluoribacter dumoffii]MCW8453526.1 FtsX-like permease family protein [Fluoribacter dumoffii]MCW8459255.1 FtsX-like permease family protein [Fluoribacter dumoffii]
MKNGLLKIAMKLLINDRGKFFTLIVGITFAVFLMMQMTSVFSGIMQRTSATIINIGSSVWVMDPSVNIQTDNIPMPNYVLDVVRSISGVKYAAPLYSGQGLVKLGTGTYQAATIIGLDDSTLLGRPKLIDGNINAIFNNDAYIAIKDTEYSKLDNPQIGTTFEVNDHRAIIIALGKALVNGLFGTPTLYTTYSRAISDLPTTRFTISYILVEPKSPQDIPYIQEQVEKLGYSAVTRQEFIDKNKNYYLYKTGLGTNLLIMTLISFIVGLSIAGQTFYTFVLENLEEYGALKAIGAKKNELIQMIFFQSGIIGFLGYGFGVLLSSVLIALAKLRLSNYASLVTYPSLLFSFFMVIVIIAFSSYLGIRKVTRIDPFDIFRG